MRDTESFARRWPGKLLIALVMLVLPIAVLQLSLSSGGYADIWPAPLMAVALAGVYLISRRLIVTVVVSTLIVGVSSALLAPTLSTSGTGDPVLLDQLKAEQLVGALNGFENIAVAQIDLDAPQPVRLAGFGAVETTRMEAGSLTKAMTGLVIADAVARGEVELDAPVSRYLPELIGSPAGEVTLAELVTHTAGYADFGSSTEHRAAWSAPLGLNFLTTTAEEMTEEIREQYLFGRGSWAYSNLGAATAGQAVAAATGMSYSELMRTRLFEPLKMNDTAIQDDEALVPGGRSQSGLIVHPWVINAYAPSGAIVSTTEDLARLATALLDGTAPGMAALDPTITIGTDMDMGVFWLISPSTDDQTITWHTGETGGYSSYFALDRTNNKAVIVLSDVVTPATATLGTRLLTANG
ncbi:serine hydrolase domain-containing protein [Cryobacterium sp. BB307]|uniref:serine hydrolase domain-containing protein n=1 Tax=Cryobacterium sp. BB307 TaxID=2716317 RepID=UPI0014463314|nr:serine hydrolase domain-containing protein [Cryobacterium sp. BB307]